MFQFPPGARDFSVYQIVQTGSEAYPVAYTVGTGGSFSWSKGKVDSCEAVHFHLVPSLGIDGGTPPHLRTN